MKEIRAIRIPLRRRMVAPSTHQLSESGHPGAAVVPGLQFTCSAAPSQYSNGDYRNHTVLYCMFTRHVRIRQSRSSSYPILLSFA
jgi:hypothetical protein